MAKLSERELTAYHEAAHAVFCYEAGIEMEYITMKAGNGYLAGLKNEDLAPWIRAASDQDRSKRMEGALKMLMAGGNMATLMGQTGMGTDGGDMTRITELRREFIVDGTLVKTWLDEIQARLKDSSSRTRQAIEALTRKLLAIDDRIEGSEIRKEINPFYAASSS